MSCGTSGSSKKYFLFLTIGVSIWKRRLAFMGALAYVVRVYARLVEIGAETPAKNPYVVEMYKSALEGRLYSMSIPI